MPFWESLYKTYICISALMSVHMYAYKRVFANVFVVFMVDISKIPFKAFAFLLSYCFLVVFTILDFSFFA